MEVNSYLHLIFAVISIGLISFEIWNKIKRNWTWRIIKMVWNVPGPRSYPIIGATLSVIGPTDYIWSQFRKLSKKFPRLYKIWSGNRCRIFIQNPNDIEILLSNTKNLQKSVAYDVLSIWLGTGLLISSGNKWKSRRRILTPAFHFNILKGFVDIFENQSLHSSETLQNEVTKEGTNVIPIVTEHALYSLCETTMGISIHPNIDDDIRTYKNGINDFGQIFMDTVSKPWLYSKFIYDRTQIGQNMSKTVFQLQKFTRKVLQDRLDTWDPSVTRSVESASGKRILPMMDLLISEMKNGADIDYEGIREEVDTFMFEGHDTTSMNTSLLLMLLANNPDVQDRILEEQNQIFGESNRKSSYEDLQSMTYLEMAIRESLRLYPSVPIVGRTLDEDLCLDGVTLPAGINVFIMIYDLHRNPKYWSNPEKFDPNRFLPENAAKRHPFSYIPFSAGSRNCIGQKFAMLEMKSFVSNILRKYILEPIDTPESIVFKADLVIRPKGEIRVRFRNRFRPCC